MEKEMTGIQLKDLEKGMKKKVKLSEYYLEDNELTYWDETEKLFFRWHEETETWEFIGSKSY